MSLAKFPSGKLLNGTTYQRAFRAKISESPCIFGVSLRMTAFSFVSDSRIDHRHLRTSHPLLDDAQADHEQHGSDDDAAI